MSDTDNGLLVPMAASQPGKVCKWHPVNVATGLITVSGGFNKGFLLASSIDLTVDTTTHAYVQLDKNAAWFLKGVGGTANKRYIEGGECFAKYQRQV